MDVQKLIDFCNREIAYLEAAPSLNLDINEDWKAEIMICKIALAAINLFSEVDPIGLPEL